MSKNDENAEEEMYTDQSESPSKKHKRHKKHKKKKSQSNYDSDAVDVVNDDESLLVEMTIAEKFKTQTNPVTPSVIPPIVVAISATAGVTPKSTNNLNKQKKKKGRNKDSGTSSEEERWLDAIESGKLEQVDDELKKIKDPKLMTARQRAMYKGGADKEPCLGGEILMALPSGYKEKVMTAEAIQKAQLKSQKRKQLADEKREKDKKKTMERLLKKQDSKISKNAKNRLTKITVPVITYKNSITHGATVTFPPNYEIPLQKISIIVKSENGTDQQQQLLKSKQCALCGLHKRYNCSRTNIPLCSFKCYKQNVASLKEIIC